MTAIDVTTVIVVAAAAADVAIGIVVAAAAIVVVVVVHANTNRMRHDDRPRERQQALVPHLAFGPDDTGARRPPFDLRSTVDSVSSCSKGEACNTRAIEAPVGVRRTARRRCVGPFFIYCCLLKLPTLVGHY